MAGVPAPDCSAAPVSQQWPVSPVWPRWRVDTGLHTAGIWRPAARPATSVISSLYRSHTVNRRCGAGHGVCSYRDTVTSVVFVCTSVSCRVGHPGTVGAATSSKSSTSHCRETLVLEPHNHIFTCIWRQNTIESSLRYN